MAVTSFGGVVKHSQLTELAANDHPQYLRATETRSVWLNVVAPNTGTAGVVGNQALRLGPHDSVSTFNTASGINLANNLYYDGTSWRYIETTQDIVGRAFFGGLGFQFATAPAGTAGDVATLTSRLHVTSALAQFAVGNVEVKPSAAEGSARLVGGTTGRSGYVSFSKPDNTRAGYIGWAESNSHASDRGVLEHNSGGHDFYVAGVKRFALQTNFDALGGAGIFHNGNAVAIQGHGPVYGTNAQVVNPNVTYAHAMNLNGHYGSGLYNGSATTNNPWGDSRWIWLQVFTHVSGSHWQKQICHDMTGGSSVYYRKCNGGDPTSAGSWTGWSYLNG